MKFCIMKIKGLIMIALGLLLLTACSRPLEDRVESFVSKTEARYEKYTEEDWQKSMQEYQALAQEYKDNYQSYSKEERDRINKAFGKYTGILLKQGLSTAGNALQQAIDGASSFMKGVFDSMESEE